VEAGQAEALRAIRRDLSGAAQAAAGRKVYRDTGAFAQARTRAERLRERALATAADVPGAAVQDLLRFLVRIACPQRRA
jgi:hypothetical protein